MTIHDASSINNQSNYEKELSKKASSNSTNGISDSSIQQLEIAHIAQYFIYNYYNIMSLEPEKLHLFYSDDSYMSFGLEGDQNPKDCAGSASIHEHFMSLGLKNSNISITTLDFQPSIEGCIIVHIIGDLIKSTQQSESHIDPPTAIKFVQSFLLARQHNGYYILNDCMRYIRIPTVLQRFPCSYDSTMIQKLGNLSDHGIEGQDIPNIPVTNDFTIINPDHIDKSESPIHTNPNSWASLVSNKIQSVTATPDNTPVKCSSVDVLEIQTSTEQSKDHTNTQYGSGSAHADLSVFIKGVECHMTASDVLPLLETFGEITYIDIVVEKNCAFANFKNSSGAKAAIGQVIHVKGCDLMIEQRKFRYGQRKYTQDGFQHQNRDTRRRHDTNHRHIKRDHNIQVNVA